MGSGQSKQSKDNKNSGHRRTNSPNQEKHNSADSKTPLTRHANDFSVPRSPSPTQLDSSSATSPPANRGEDQLASTPAPSIEIDEQEGHSNVTRPPPPPRLRRLSELIDPHELTIDSHVRSPSGNLLAVEQFLVHPDRPRSMRERQEQIREKVRAASRLGQELENAGDERQQTQVESSKKTERVRGRILCGCFCGS